MSFRGFGRGFGDSISSRFTRHDTMPYSGIHDIFPSLSVLHGDPNTPSSVGFHASIIIIAYNPNPRSRPLHTVHFYHNQPTNLDSHHQQNKTTKKGDYGISNPPPPRALPRPL